MIGDWSLVKGFIYSRVLEEFDGGFKGEDDNSGVKR